MEKHIVIIFSFDEIIKQAGLNPDEFWVDDAEVSDEGINISLKEK